MIREHELAASMMGIPVARYKLTLFVISSAMIGIQGSMTAHLTGSVMSDNYTLALSISAVAMILIGGLDTAAGPLVGAAVITLLPLLVPRVLGMFVNSASISSNAGNYSQIVYGVLIVVFIVGAPKGLVGMAEKGVRDSVQKLRGMAGAGGGATPGGRLILDEDASSRRQTVA
jgi:branched-chain amino acid transport system permease protein